jgi:hypothetical protein
MNKSTWAASRGFHKFAESKTIEKEAGSLVSFEESLIWEALGTFWEAAFERRFL